MKLASAQRSRSASLLLPIATAWTCSSSAGDSGTGDDARAVDAGTDASVPAFECTPPAATPTLASTTWLHPTEPVAGQAVTLSVQIDRSKGDAPPLVARLENSAGTREVSASMVVGDAQALFYFTLADLNEGDNCIAVMNGASVEAAIELDVPAPTPLAPGNGVWKVTSNHQWRCDEQPTFGNLLHVEVVDEDDAPMEGVTVDVAWTEDVEYPVPPDDAAQSWDEHGQPKTLVTDDSGRAELFTPWGEGIRSPIDAKPGLIVYQLSVAGGASDTATEISTGLWETDDAGCSFCGQDAVNVFGHWSYTVRFQRDPDATEVCEVPTDHAGQTSCSIDHFYHDPVRPSCRPVAPR